MVLTAFSNCFYQFKRPTKRKDNAKYWDVDMRASTKHCDTVDNRWKGWYISILKKKYIYMNRAPFYIYRISHHTQPAVNESSNWRIIKLNHTALWRRNSKRRRGETISNAHAYCIQYDIEQETIFTQYQRRPDSVCVFLTLGLTWVYKNDVESRDGKI